mmetsp:Transcript_12788/g.28099  ORF Transcript_12788/g.28099 Transcript_12788/m.28099 type:complete len:368 (-) Transcript_12788:37-1140(-)
MDGDFLWDCAFVHDDRSRSDIIPDFEDDARHFCAPLRGFPEHSASVSYHQGLRPSLPDSLSVSLSVSESRGDGVLDIIGGELWEGALLLCAYILHNPGLFLASEVLELGSGVGLPGLLLVALKSLSWAGAGVTLTDNDPRVLAGLQRALAQFEQGHSAAAATVTTATAATAATTAAAAAAATATTDVTAAEFPGSRGPRGPRGPRGYVPVRVRQLDWSAFIGSGDGAHTDDTVGAVGAVDDRVGVEGSVGVGVETGFTGTRPPRGWAEAAGPIHTQVLMGCELCYAPHHAPSLAGLLQSCLAAGVREVVVVQMRDREGFRTLLELLSRRGVAYSLEEVSGGLLATAQMIACTRSAVGAVGAVGAVLY